MKTEINYKILNINLLIIVFFVMMSVELFAQESPSNDSKNFKIVVEKTEIGIKIKSIEGTAWIDLSFTTNNNQPQAIDEYGMTKLNKTSSKKDFNLSDFLFTIKKTESGFVLKGIEGTAWTNLSFSLTENGKQAIDRFGMIKLN